MHTLISLAHLKEQFPGLRISSANTVKLLCQVTGWNCLLGLAMPSDTELLHCFPPRPKPSDYPYRKIQGKRPASNSNKEIFQHSCIWGSLALIVHHPECGVIGCIKEQSLGQCEARGHNVGGLLKASFNITLWKDAHFNTSSQSALVIVSREIV